MACGDWALAAVLVMVPSETLRVDRERGAIAYAKNGPSVNGVYEKSLVSRDSFPRSEEPPKERQARKKRYASWPLVLKGATLGDTSRIGSFFGFLV